MPIIATAGHVDHGKSTLVQALTGRDPDRWAEEKDRGLTIDLGFAWTVIGHEDVGFVDVPGHERFIKNMLAGVGSLDVALFVVAADEGWMPQSEEHMAVLDLLEVRHGVIALTRVDVTERDAIDLATLEVEEAVEGSSLAGWPIVEVAAPTGQGLDDLRKHLVTALAAAGTPRDVGRPRLWVDRSFVISGAGVVVTGTLSDGPLVAGDAAELWPGPRTVRIRSLQSHETSQETAVPGSRVAANLAGLERDDVARGALLTGVGLASESTRFLGTVRPVGGIDEIADRGAYQLHAGSGAWPARVRSVATGVLLITTNDPVPLVCGDRFILRETGRRAVVGGGRILDPHPSGRSTASLAAAAEILSPLVDGPPDELATALLQVRGSAELPQLAIDSGGGAPLGGIIGGDKAMHRDLATTIAQQLVTAVEDFHETNPLRPGIPKASLASSHGLDGALLDALLEGDSDLVDDGATVRAADHGASWSAADEVAWEAAATELRQSGLAAPRSSRLGLRDELLHAAIREGRLTRITNDLCYLPEQLEDMTSRLQTLPHEFTVAEFRDVMAISRRQAIPLLEWLDGSGRTTRRGDVRSLRRRSAQ
ncbi:MAG: selenocysteine-specific translation elongation factor [bacterium]|nr:selenocysteine-specific translation elongation factor [bacterium]